jgi:tetratricopeptide (TPR) repeat protein
MLLAATAAAPLQAQRRVPPTSPSTASTNTTAVRAELAAVLLQSKKYTEAAREYRTLLSRDSTNFEYRLGLARALAWGNRFGEAERELRILQGRHLQILTVDSLLRAVRDAMDPRASEAATWVAERPTYGPYRLAYARALAKERAGRRAGAQYDTLLQGTSLGPLPDPLMLRHERARAYLDAGDLAGGVASLRDLLRWSPRDTSVRHELAVILTNGSAKAEGRAQYDTLVATAPTAALFTERGRLRLALGDTSGAESDMLAALPLGGTATAYVTLGDLYRERGDFGPARTMYRIALTRLGNERANRIAVEAELASMSREERPVAAFVPTVGDDPGWRVSSDAVGDNLGVHYAASTVRGTAPIGDDVRAGIAVIHHYLGERSPSRSINLTAVGLEGMLSGQVSQGSFLGQAAIEAGGLHLPLTGVMPIGTVTLASWISTWQMAVAGSAGPAYPTLLTTTSLEPLTGDDPPITDHSLTESIGGPLGPADVAAMAQQTRLSDGNHRTTAQAFVRLPLMPGLSVVYSGTRIAFSSRSTQYWDPIDYSAHGVGLEIGSHGMRGLSAAMRVIPGVAWSVEAPPDAAPVRSGRFSQQEPPTISRETFQVSGGGEVTWRDPSWEGVAALTYGQGRTGDYRRVGVTLGVRVIP